MRQVALAPLQALGAALQALLFLLDAPLQALHLGAALLVLGLGLGAQRQRLILGGEQDLLAL